MLENAEPLIDLTERVEVIETAIKDIEIGITTISDLTKNMI